MIFPKKIEPYTTLKLLEAGIQFGFNILILQILSSEIVSQTILIVNTIGVIYQIIDFSQGNIILSKNFDIDIKNFIFKKRGGLLFLSILMYGIIAYILNFSPFIVMYTIYIIILTGHKTFSYFFLNQSHRFNTSYYIGYILLTIINIALILYSTAYRNEVSIFIFLFLNGIILLLPFLLLSRIIFTRKFLSLEKIIHVQRQIITLSIPNWINQISYVIKVFCMAYFIDRHIPNQGKEFKLILMGGTIIATLAYSFLHQFYSQNKSTEYFRISFKLLLKALIPACIIIIAIGLYTNIPLTVYSLIVVLLQMLLTGIYLILTTYYTLSFNKKEINTISSLNGILIVGITSYFLFKPDISNSAYNIISIFAAIEILLLILCFPKLFFSFWGPVRKQ